MVWFWSRNQEELQFETMYDNDTAEFLVRLTFSNGTQSTERFDDESLRFKRQAQP
jgi:hypothetical protein